MTGYPWSPGDELLAADLNAAISAASSVVAGGTLSGPLYYTATGGVVARSAQDRAGEIVNIKDLGAVCDGTTDDTAAWTVAFAMPSGTVIRIPQNCVTIITANFRATGGRAISIIGEGRGSVIRMKPGTALTSDVFVWVGGATNVRLENFTFDFNNCPQPSALRQVFALGAITGLVVRNVAVIRASANLYHISIGGPCSDFVVEDCYLQQTTPSSTVQSKGIVTLGGGQLNVFYGRISNNFLVNTNTNFAGAGRLYISGNDISGWGVGAGIATDLIGELNTVIGNSCHDSQTATDFFGITPNGIETWSARTVIANNKCWNNAGSGIAQGGLNGILVGNLCWDNATGATVTTGVGIGVNKAGSGDASGTALVGNYCYDSGVGRQQYGFRVGNSGIINLSLASNRFSGTLGDVLLSNATFISNFDYVPRILAGDPTLPLQAATKQYVDARGPGTRQLFQSSTLVGNGADLTQDVLQTFSVPANTLANVGDRLVVRAGGSFISSTDTKIVAVQWGGNNATTFTGNTASAQSWRLDGEIMKTANGVQTTSFQFVSNGSTTQTSTNTISRSDTIAELVTITGQNTTASTASSITCRYFTVDYVAAN